MKLLKRVSILAVLITVIAVFAGCGKEATVVGTWEGDDYTYTFNDDGTGIQQIGEISVSITSYEAKEHNNQFPWDRRDRWVYIFNQEKCTFFKRWKQYNRT